MAMSITWALLEGGYAVSIVSECWYTTTAGAVRARQQQTHTTPPRVRNMSPANTASVVNLNMRKRFIVGAAWIEGRSASSIGASSAGVGRLSSLASFTDAIPFFEAIQRSLIAGRGVEDETERLLLCDVHNTGDVFLVWDLVRWFLPPFLFILVRSHVNMIRFAFYSGAGDRAELLHPPLLLRLRTHAIGSPPVALQISVSDK